MAKDNITALYGALKDSYELGSEDDFRKYLSDGNNREALRKELENDYEVGDSAAFSKYLGFEDKPQPTESPFPKDPMGLQQMQKDNLRDRSIIEDARYKAEKNKPQVQQPEVKPAAVQQPKPAQQGKGGLTWQEQMAMSMGTQQMVGQVKAGNERIDSTINNTKNMSPVGNGLTPVGMNKNLRTEKKFNAEKGQFEDVYKTTSGQTFSADRAFDADQQQKYEDYQNERSRYIETMEGLGLGDMLEEGNKDVEARLEDAYAEKERLQKLIKEGRYGQMGRMARAGLLAGSAALTEEDNANAREYDNLLAAMRMLDRRITALQAERDEAGFLQGTGDVLTDPSTYSMGLTDASDALAMANIKKKIDAAKGGKPNFTEGEKMLVRNYLMNQDAQQLNENRGWLYNFGQGFGQTLSFMADFALAGGGFGNLAKGGLKMGAKMGAKALATDVAQYMTKNLGAKSAKILEKSVMFGSKTAGMALGAEVGGAALAGTIQAPKTLANIAERHMGNLTVSKDGTFEFKGGESEAKAAILGFLDASGENASELVGPGIDAVAGKIAKYAVGKYGTKIAESAAGKFVKGFTDNKVWKSGEKTLGFLGVNSVFGEGMEEEYGMMRTSILNAITNNEFNPNAEGLTDLNNQLNTWATVGLTSVILRTPQMIASGKKQATYYGYKYNLNTTDKMMRNTFNDDVRYQSVKDMLDNTENKDFGNALHNIVSNAELTPEEKKAVVMYANDLIALRGFNIGDAVAAANGIHDTPRTDRYNISGNTIEEVDKNGNVLATHEYDSREEMKSALWEMQTKRANDDLQSDISVMKARPNNQFEILVDEYAAEAGVNPEEVENVLNKNPMDRTAVDQQLLAPFAKKLHEAVYDSSMLHEEQSTEDGQDIADTIELEPENMAPEQTQDVADVRARWEGARMAREQLFERNEDIAQEVYRLMAQNLSDQEIISSLSSFREEEVQIVIDYYNQRAKFEGMLNRLNDKIDEEARNRRDRNTFKGTINGNPDQQNIYTITDGENTYTLVSGNITMDADGNITSSDSGMLIGVDANGDFVTIGDSNGYTIANGGSLDEYEEAQRAILQEGVSSVVDPDDSMQAAPAPEEETAETVVPGPETTEEVAANAGGEAGVEDSTGANEPSAPATIPVDDNGLKRYEQGVSVDDAIVDLGNDGFDVNEMADAYIAEAQEQIDKINNKKAKLPKDIVERKRLQGVVDYYNQLKARNLELNPPYVDPQPYLDELKNAQSKTKADEILNRAITAGVKTEEVQPAHTQKVQEILAKQEEARRRAEEVTDKDMQDIAEKSSTPEGRAWLLDKKRVTNAEKRRKMAKLIYKELFDDDFEAYRDINELISMWLSKGRTLDPDTFGQELGWDMGIGKDAAKVSTMFAARRENGGDGMLFNDFVHMVAEASEGRYDTQEVRNALIGMFQGAQEKSDLTEYQLTNRVAEAERLLVEAEIRDKEAAEEVKTGEEKPISEGLLPFPPATEEEPFGNVEATEQQEETETPEDPAAEEEPQTEDNWQYNLHYDKVTGRVWIDREQVGPTGIPIGDGRWHIEAKSLAEMRGILENPANNLGKVYEQVEARLHNEEIGEQLRNESNPMDAIEQTAEQFSNEQEKPNNANTEDNSVNVNKTEDNEAENVVSSQEEEVDNGNNAVEMQGDSAEYAEQEKNRSDFGLAVFDALRTAVFQGDIKLKTMQGVKALAKEYKLDHLSMTDLQELVEAQIVNLARKISENGEWTDEQKFEHIKHLYEWQPTLSARDNDRINKQQYSTPAPMAWLMGKFVDPKHEAESGLEPSAGNGMLTIALPKGIMHVNDIDEMRLSNLAQQGFKEVTNQDGTQPFEPKAYDVVVTNPPFGNVAPKMYDGYETTGLEHQMAINALDSMKDDGRAAIIIGGNTEYKDNGSIKGKDRAFLNYLYSHYNVVDVINIDGKAMYAKQGTGYNVRMILINGRKQADGTFAPVQSKARAEQVNSYDELYKRVNDDILSDSNRPASVHDTESGESGRVDDNSNAGESTEKRVRNVRAEGSSEQHSGRTESRSDASGRTNTTEPGTERSGREVVGGPVSDDRSGAEAAKPSESASVSEEDGNRTESERDNAERLPAEPSNSERVGQRGTEPTQPTEQPERKRSLGAEKVPYNKQSQNPFTLQSLMPAEQADVVKKALEELGDTDQFLVDELGYSSKEELHKALAAEQIDSVAMAIHQMNQGNAFIIGDQTGIGKGRQAAALIRYGVKKGGFPVFITVKKGLFSDMYRDLCDIGSPKLRPFIWSADDAQHSANVTDKDGKVIYELPSAKEQKRVVEYINQHGKLPKEYDYVLTTYDSFKSGTMDYENGEKKARSFGKKQPSAVHFNGQAKRDALERLAESSYVIMDESHNAGGEGSNVSGYLQYITTKAKGLTFLSATFAKRPGNMPIYSLKTAISKAGVKIDELIDSVKRGGATFQEIMSKALTEAGQMIRRERDMTGVTIDWRGIEDEAVIAKQREQYDQIIGLFNDIIDFQRTYVDPIVDSLNDDAAESQGEVEHTPGTRDMGINNTPFASRTYNIVQQVLLSLKAEEAAKRAIEHLKMGHKPVITVANTNEGAADEVAGVGGEAMEMPDLSINLRKGLEGTMRISSTDANGNTTKSEIPFDKLSEEGQNRYREIMDAINNASTGLSLSPIDVIKNELKKAGYKVGELTGRKAEFVYNEDGTVKRVNRQDTDKKMVAADFNSGKIDALILNRSAGTGISLHASTKFEDQRQRVMIVAQAQGDVNDEVQIRGRIDRTGQVLRGMYEYVVSQIPSEQRLLMMLKAKLRSLDANTTSSQKSKFNEMDVQDIINKYGDQIVIQYLAEHPDTYAKLADPLKWGDTVFTMSPEALVESANKVPDAGGTASKILGRMALLKVTEQEQMLDDLGALYTAEINRLNEMGENDLEITEMPLNAKTLNKQVWEQGVEPGGKNPFADNTYVEKVEMDVLVKPMKGSEVKASQERLLGGKTWDEYKQGVLADVEKLAENKKAEATETYTARATKKATAERDKYVKGATKAKEKNGMSDADIEKNGQYQYDHFYKEEMDKLKGNLADIDKQKQVFVDALETFTTDGVYVLPEDIYDLGGMSFDTRFGKLIDVKIASNCSTAASTLSFATLDGRRKITIPISGMVTQKNGKKQDIKPWIVQHNAQVKSGMMGSNPANTLKVLEQNLDNWDRLTSTATRKEGYIITGNLLKALVETKKQGKGGKLISYTTDTGEVRQGILMSDQFDPSGLTAKTPISTKIGDLRRSGDKVESADKEVTVRVTNDYDWHNRGYNTLSLTVPKSAKKGAKYFNDEKLLSLVDGQFEGSGNMKAEFDRANLEAVMKRLDELGVVVAEEHKEDAPKRMISTYEPMEAINQAAESWRQERKASPTVSKKAKDVTDFINSLPERFGIKGGSKTYVINSMDDIEALRGTLSDSAIDVIKNEYNDPDVPAAYLVTSNVVVIFGEKVEDMKDAEVAYWHEQTHSFWNTLPADVRNIIGEACFDFLKRNYPHVYNHIKNRYSEDVWLEEACSFLMGEVVAENGTAKLLNDNFAGNEIICTFANRLRNYIKYGRQERNNQLRRNEVEQGSKVSRRSETGQRRKGDSLRSEEEQVTDPIEAIEQSAKRWKREHNDAIAGEDTPEKHSAAALYEDRLNRVETVFTEAYQDSMVSLKTAQNAIAKDSEIPDSQNAYQAENLMHGKNKNEQDLFNQMFRDPLIKAINAILNKTGWNWGDVDRYVYAKSALERNREFFVRDHTTKEKVLNDWYQLKQDLYEDLQDGRIGYYEYLMEQDFFIKTNIDSDYDPNENDYSGLRAMYGDEKGNFNDGDIVADVEATEAVLGDDVTADLWEKINAATTYGLERYREAGMRSDEQIDRVERMFNFYVPMRGFKKDTGEDMYQYFTEKGNRKSYVGGLLKHAKGRGSEANYPISTIFAMGYKAIADCNQNLVCQKLYRLCQANPNDLIVLSDSWAKLNPITQEWEEAYPDIDDDMDEEDIRQTVKAFEEQMKIEEAAGNAKKIRGKASFSYKPTDKKKRSEHVVDVRINGDYKRMIVTGNPRMAQALNGQLRFEHGKNVFSNWNAKIKNLMASLFTSYSPTFALRNLFRDWTHFRTMLGVREGHDYAAAANKYYRKSLFKMVGLFKKYREGTLDMNNEMERDFKDFMDNGGVTGFVMMQKVDDIQKDMEKLYKQQKEGKVVKLNNALWDNTIGLIEAVNEGIENNARFATFRASRHFAGRTKARSAYDAKEITVNFNKKGAGSKTKGYKSDSKTVEDAAAIFGVTSQVLGEGRIFFNATVQAIATTFKNFQNPDGSLNYGYISKWTAKYALPPFMFGLLLPYINQMLAAALDGDDNDDDPYANLAEWTRRKNICIYIGHNNFITIPIGQELAAFLTLGDITAGLTYAPDVRPVDRDIKDEMIGVMNTFSPIDVDTKMTKGGFMEDPISETVGRTFSVAAPLVAIEQNIGWTGRPIYREDKYQNDEYTPEYQMVYQSTNPLLVDALKMVHEMGGGDDIRRGKIEVNPGIVQYLWEQYTGGPGKFLANTISIGKDVKDVIMGNDNNFNIRKVEGVKAFVQQGDDRTEHYRAQAKYRKYLKDARELKDAVDGYKKDKGVNPEHALKYDDIRKGNDYIRMSIILEADKQLSKLYKEANKAEGAKRKELYKKYNELVAKVVKKLDEVGDE